MMCREMVPDEPREPFQLVSHRGPGFNMNPPSLLVNLSLVFLPFRVNVFLYEGERPFIKRSIVYRCIGAKVNDPDIPVSAGHVQTVDPGNDHVAVGPSVRVGGVQEGKGESFGDIESPPLGIPHEGESGILDQSSGLGNVRLRREVTVDSFDLVQSWVTKTGATDLF